MRLILVKWGGSLITDKAKEQAARLSVLRRLARQLAVFLAGAPDDVRIVLSHGSGSYGHAAARGSALVGNPASADEGGGLLAAATVTQLAAAQLHGLVHGALVQEGVRAFGLRPGSLLIAENGNPELLNAEPLERALELGCVVLVHGDVVVDRSKGFSICSTETLLYELAERLARLGHIEGAIWLGETAGLLDENGSTVAELEPSQNVSRWIRATRGMDVTGGMAHRIETVRRFSDLGVASILGNGLQPGLFGACLDALVQGPDRPGWRAPDLTTWIAATKNPEAPSE